MEKQKLIQFLMGLNKTFAQSRSHILMTVPSPSLNQAYNMIMQDESQRTQSQMITASTVPLQQLDINGTTTLASVQHNKVKKSSDLYCEYCHLRNHTIKNCYKLIGYPTDHKFGKRSIADRSNRKSQYGGENKRFGGEKSQRFAGNRRPQAYNAHYRNELEVANNR